MKEQIETRIECLMEFRQLLEVIGVNKDFGSGLDEAYKNEINFLQKLASIQQAETSERKE